MIEQKPVSTSLPSLGKQSTEIPQQGLVGGQNQELAGLYRSQL